MDIDGTGPGTSGPYSRDIFLLLNVNATALTAENFAGYAPGGADLVHNVVTGSAGPEWLAADPGGSDLNGLAGDDRLVGNIGADRIDGGAGNDIIDGGGGNDVIRGGDGDDVITDPAGADTIDGGAGNDIINIVRLAGVGNAGPVTIIAGDGDDFVHFDSPDGAVQTIDLGAGNDRIEITRYRLPISLTLGSGQDHVVLGGLFGGSNSAPLTITDFAVGNAGDVLDLEAALSLSASWSNTPGDPFTGGYLRLEQSGADTFVVFDPDGFGGSSESSTMARLVNVTATSLTAYNFAGYNPGGAPSAYTIGPATAGNDHLYGSAGTDVIDGGGGNDIIEDRLGGSDTLNGGAGDDLIIVSHSANGNASGIVTINGGTGRDIVDIAISAAGQANIDLGADDDRLIFHGGPDGGTRVTLGSGADVIELAVDYASTSLSPLTIVDFTTGAGGDRLDWALFAEQRCRNGAADFNPFLDGSARLVQVGADTQLQFTDLARHDINTIWYVLMVFANTVATSFTADNLGYPLFFPTVSGGTGDDVLTGTAGADVLHGNAGNDLLDAQGGDDVLFGHDGNDTLNGGAGNDYLRGGAGTDVLNGGADNDNLDGDMGADTVNGGDGDDLIVDWLGSDTISGGAGNDVITVTLSYGSVPGSLDAGDGKRPGHDPRR